MPDSRTTHGPAQEFISHAFAYVSKFLVMIIGMSISPTEPRDDLMNHLTNHTSCVGIKAGDVMCMHSTHKNKVQLA